MAETVLITGGAGFIGSHLATSLLEKGFKVTVFDNMIAGDWHNIRPLFNYGGRFNFINGTITDYNLVEASVKESDYVFHLAAQVHWEESINYPRESYETNVIGTLNVLEALRQNMATRNPVKLLVYASSSEVYGTSKYVPMDEDHPFNPQSPYAAGKAAGDRLCSAYHHVYKVPVVILRQFNTYGPRQRMKGYSAVIPIFVDRIMNNKPPVIYGDGNQTKDFHYIDDLIKAYELMMDNFEGLIGLTINLGTGVETAINELASILLKIMAKKLNRPNLEKELTPIHASERPGEVRRFLADTKLAKKLMGFEPQISLKQGLERYVEWFIKESA
jgi:UDP-glucose 4-epimerase